jgi:serine/threonine protein kinase
MALSTGTVLAGRYEITSPIATGGMGEVWKARDTRLNRIVAVKRLTEQHSGRFEQEARAIAALNHPHICQIYDVGADYLVLEFVEGVTLADRIRTRGAPGLPQEELLRIARQIAEGLDEAHRAGILHRDLKPANVMITTNGSTKLLDFGLARLVSREADVTQTQQGVVVGTAAYMSPEQAEGRPVDARSDVFSFGAVLYAMNRPLSTHSLRSTALSGGVCRKYPLTVFRRWARYAPFSISRRLKPRNQLRACRRSRFCPLPT